jgi:hypothetical protein
MDLAPGNAEVAFWTAVSLINAGRPDEAGPLLRRAFADTEGEWRATLGRLPAAGLLKADEALVKKLVSLPAGE